MLVRSFIPGFVIASTACLLAACGAPHGVAHSGTHVSSHYEPVCVGTDLVDCGARCDDGDAIACNDLGVLLRNAPAKERNARAAVIAFRRSCDRHFGPGCRNLAGQIETGDGARNDVLLASKLYAIACDHGDLPACTRLGVLFAMGRGVVEDRLLAAVLLSTACDAGEREACGRRDALGLQTEATRTSAEPAP